jgi:phosphoglycolate phosphatase
LIARRAACSDPSMSKPPIAVFDLDGTLADTAGDLMGALNFVLEQDGIAPLPVDQARTLLGAGGRALIERGFAVSGRSLEKPRLEELFKEFLADYESHIAAQSALFPGVVAALDRLERGGYAFAVCTNKMERTSIMLLDALGVTQRFRAICGQDTFGFYKPDARTLPAVIAKAGGEPGRSVMVGDSITDIAAAKNAGIPVIAVDFGYTDKPVSELGPDRIIAHFDALDEAVASLVPA